MRTLKRMLLPLALTAALLTGCGASAATLPAEGSAQQPPETGAAITDTPEAPEEHVPQMTEPETQGENTPPVAEPEKSAASVPGKAAAAAAPTGPTCTVSISCAILLEHSEELDVDKVELVPADGWILPATTATFTEGESVFDVLLRVCREQGISMEYQDTPLYDSAYIEGIANLYEFDCGALSGWVYSVNGWHPNYGCSQYALQDGDTVCWDYTCDLGADIGTALESGAATGPNMPTTVSAGKRL